jgi:hypothetical protein
MTKGNNNPDPPRWLAEANLEYTDDKLTRIYAETIAEKVGAIEGNELFGYKTTINGKELEGQLTRDSEFISLFRETEALREKEEELTIEEVKQIYERWLKFFAESVGLEEVPDEILIDKFKDPFTEKAHERMMREMWEKKMAENPLPPMTTEEDVAEVNDAIGDSFEKEDRERGVDKNRWPKTFEDFLKLEKGNAIRRYEHGMAEQAAKHLVAVADEGGDVGEMIGQIREGITDRVWNWVEDITYSGVSAYEQEEQYSTDDYTAILTMPREELIAFLNLTTEELEAKLQEEGLSKRDMMMVKGILYSRDQEDFKRYRRDAYGEGEDPEEGWEEVVDDGE